MADDNTRDRAVYQALKAADEVAAALQAHLVEEHGHDPEPDGAGEAAAPSLRLLRQARDRIGEGLRAIDAEEIAETDRISLRRDP